MRSRRARRRGGAAAALVCAVTTAACLEGEAGALLAVPGGDPARGARLLGNYGCGQCHVIPGVADAVATAGPPLTEWSARRYIAGALLNTPENLMRWITDPDAVEPGTAMPDLDVGTAEARDMAAYLFTLRLEDPLGPPHLLPVRILESLLPGRAP
ncbi:MAG TPA: c-type cytochrome [Longimicrobiales bacterium]